MPSVASEPSENGRSAPTYYIPAKRIVSIEHPCIVKNFDNGFKSLGGEHHLKHVLEHEVGDSKQQGVEPVAVASLRPDDLFAQRISSTATATHNVLVKVTLPKRTGRKRKRGSNDAYQRSPMTGEPRESITAAELLDKLRDNTGKYTMEAIGIIEDTHHFRSLPDFQISAEDDPTMREIRNHALNPDYRTLKRFRVNHPGQFNGETSFPAPPSFLPTGVPYQYEYNQLLGGDRSTRHRHRRGRSSVIENGVALESDTVPQSPPIGYKTPAKAGQKVVAALKSVLEKRPIITLRAAASLLNCHYTKLNTAFLAVGYYVTKGPWEGTIVKYGVDPRSDSKYRVYQTLQINFEGQKEINAELKRRQQNGSVHLFDGKTLHDVSRYWQLCDLVDPILQALVNADEFRAQCDIRRFGWYKNGTLVKIRVIMREKMLAIVHRDEMITESGYSILAALPSRIDNEFQCKLDKEAGHYLHKMAHDIAREAISGPFRCERRTRRKGYIPGVPRTDSSAHALTLGPEFEENEEGQDLDVDQSNGESSADEDDGEDDGEDDDEQDEGEENGDVMEE